MTTSLPRFGAATLRRAGALILILVATLATGCNGGGGASLSAGSGSTTSLCDSGMPSTTDCGQIYVGLTDADGDFLGYTVDVTSLTLKRADGTTVEALPHSTRVDFTRYASLTEFLTAATVPTGTYVAGTLTVDYSDASIFVEQNGQAVQATAVQPDGSPAGVMRLNVQLADGTGLVVRPGVPALLDVDFNLQASNAVDLSGAAPTVTAQPFVIASLVPQDNSEFRVRGPLVSVDTTASSYDVVVRPFHRENGSFGPLTVHVTASTTYEIDGQGYSGAAGLAALAALPATTATIAQGTFSLSSHTFSASEVYAGSSVPGGTLDAIQGNVTARSANQITVQGATLIRSGASAVFNDHVNVALGSATRVTRAGEPAAALDIGAISVGQRVQILGTLTDPSTGNLTLDASQGFVRLLPTHVTGTLTRIQSGQINLDVQSIDGRRVSVFDFSGTGTGPSADADPSHYEIAIGAMAAPGLTVGDPIRVTGFASAFGTAPPDFTAMSVTDFSHAHAGLAVSWGISGTTAPFITIDSSSLVIDLANPDLGALHHLRRGSLVTDLTSLPASPRIVPGTAGLGLFAIAQNGTVKVYTSFADFEADLASRLDGSVTMHALFARGGFDAAANTFTATRIGVLLGG
ncbi:MAG: metallophosphoesterase [Gammaproteobacteria bacterium]|jgi:hypothetical protein